MAAAASAELTFVNKDELPVAFLHIARAVHIDSENEEPSDTDSSASEESSYETEDEDDSTEDGNDQDYSNLQWSCHVQAPGGVDFNEDMKASKLICLLIPLASIISCYSPIMFTN